MKRIAVVIPYFGSWPRWVDLFFHSCLMNDTMDFYFFTDCARPQVADVAKNLYFRSVSFQRYCDLVSEKLNIKFHPDNPYKLCDLKPFYGIIHDDILSNYDFWGFGDLDLVWGDVRKFYTDEILEKYDVLSTHADRISGHFTLIRNLPEFTMAALRIHDWEWLMENKKHIAFDEQHYTLAYYPQAKWLWKIHKHVFFKFKFNDEWTSYNNFVKRMNRLFGVEKHKLYFVEQNTTPWFTEQVAEREKKEQRWQCRYSDGRMFDLNSGKELMYLHFLSLKNYWKEDYYHVYDTMGTVLFDINGIYNS